jgi:hypothetical protein
VNLDFVHYITKMSAIGGGVDPFARRHAALRICNAAHQGWPLVLSGEGEGERIKALEHELLETRRQLERLALLVLNTEVAGRATMH